MASPSKIAVLGTGALGTLMAARLARAGHSVTFAGTWQAALEAASEGLHIEDAGDHWMAEVEVRQRQDLGPNHDLVLVLTKSYGTADCAPYAASACGPGGLILSLQNGLGNVERLGAAAGRAEVAGGTTDCAATLLAPGRARSGGGGRVVLGRLAGGPATPRIQAAAALLQSAGLEASVTPDLEAAHWTKLAINCAINPLAALAGVQNGELVTSEPRRHLLAAIAEEVGEIGRCSKIDLARDLGRQAIDCARRTATNRCSMLQDLERGRPTEIDSLSGAVADRARQLGQPAPLNDFLHRTIAGRGPRPTSIDLDQLVRDLQPRAPLGATA